MTNDGTPADAPALAFAEPLIVPAPEGVDNAISEVMARHEDEFNAALEPFGVELGELMQATWMRFVRIGDVQALYGGQVHSSVLRGALGFDDADERLLSGEERDLVGVTDEPPLRGDLEGSVPTRNLLPLGRQDDCSSGEACGAQCSAVRPAARDYCSAYREADGMSCLFREGHTSAHDYSRRDSSKWTAGHRG